MPKVPANMTYFDFGPCKKKYIVSLHFRHGKYYSSRKKSTRQITIGITKKQINTTTCFIPPKTALHPVTSKHIGFVICSGSFCSGCVALLFRHTQFDRKEHYVKLEMVLGYILDGWWFDIFGIIKTLALTRFQLS
jgi:hypothetical protein